MGLKMASDAVGRCVDSVDNSIERLAKFAGLLQSGSQTTVKLDVAMAASVSFEKVGLPGKGDLTLGELVAAVSSILAAVRDIGHAPTIAAVAAVLTGESGPAALGMGDGT